MPEPLPESPAASLPVPLPASLPLPPPVPLPAPLTLDGFRADLAECLFLEPGEVDLEESPLDAGLDSLRIVTLLEGWQAAGAEVTFVDLAERTSFAQWWRLLSERTGGAGHADA